jgi:hypothetical protein
VVYPRIRETDVDDVIWKKSRKEACKRDEEGVIDNASVPSLSRARR